MAQSCQGQGILAETENALNEALAFSKKAPPDTGPAFIRGRFLKEALERLVQFYEATNQPGQAAEWKKKLAEFDDRR